MTRPETFYDALRALRRAPRSGLDAKHMNVATETAILAALGWPEPEPVMGTDGKPVKVWSLMVTYVLPDKVRGEILADRVVLPHRKPFTDITGLLVAKSKAEAIRRAGWAPRGRRAYTTTGDVGEVSVLSLDYPVAATRPGHLLIIEPSRTWTLPVEFLRDTLHTAPVTA